MVVSDKQGCRAKSDTTASEVQRPMLCFCSIVEHVATYTWKSGERVTSLSAVVTGVTTAEQSAAATAVIYILPVQHPPISFSSTAEVATILQLCWLQLLLLLLASYRCQVELCQACHHHVSMLTQHLSRQRVGDTNSIGACSNGSAAAATNHTVSQRGKTCTINTAQPW
jgi:hypothetical protein